MDVKTYRLISIHFFVQHTLFSIKPMKSMIALTAIFAVASASLESGGASVDPFLKTYLKSEDYLVIVRNKIESNFVLLRDLGQYSEVPADVSAALPLDAPVGGSVAWNNPKAYVGPVAAVLANTQTLGDSEIRIEIVPDEYLGITPAPSISGSMSEVKPKDEPTRLRSNTYAPVALEEKEMQEVIPGNIRWFLRMEIPAGSYVHKALSKLSCLEAQLENSELTARIADGAQGAAALDQVFDNLNIGLYQLVQEVNYMMSSERFSEGIEQWNSILTQLHYRSSLFFASGIAAVEWPQFRSLMRFGLSVLGDKVEMSVVDTRPMMRAREMRIGNVDIPDEVVDEAVNLAWCCLTSCIRWVISRGATTTVAPTTSTLTPDPQIGIQRRGALAGFITSVNKDLDEMITLVGRVEGRASGDEVAFDLAIAELRSVVLSKYSAILVAALGTGFLTAAELAPANSRLVPISDRLVAALNIPDWPAVRDDIQASVGLLRGELIEVAIK